MSNPFSRNVARPVGCLSERTENQGWIVRLCARSAVVSLLLLGWGMLLPGTLQADEATDAAVASVQAHLDAGEYGLAIQKADEISDASTRLSQLRQIASRQEEAGDFRSAQVTSRRTQKTSREAGETQGGGTGADPGPLMDLIQSMTGGEATGPWSEDGLDEEGGTIEFFENGVSVDPHGVLVRLTRAELSSRLDQLGIRARNAILNPELDHQTDLRFVSLTRLEREVAARLAAGKQPLETMKLLGGLTAVRYVFVLPEEKELVIAGPGEAWRYNEHGLPVGIASGRPVLQLDDLVVVLRTFSPEGQRAFGCSIDPRAANLKATKDYLQSVTGPLAPGAMTSWLKQIEQRMGMQDIRVYGVPANSRVARVIVDADYRMKLIGVGKLKTNVGIPNIFDLMASSKTADPLPLNAYRWWLTMKYDSVLHNASKNVYEIRGSSVLVKSEDQMISDAGKQVQTGQLSPANRKFAENFTNNYGALAKQDLVFADLQNVFDLGMVAALVQREHLADKIGWNPGVFAASGDYKPHAWNAPTAVQTVMSHRVQKGTDILVQAAGGVRVDLWETISKQDLIRASDNVQPLDQSGKAPESLPAGRWWWNGAE